MQVKNLNCPNCGGSLDMNISENATFVFCPYCGQKVALDDGKKEFTINQNVNVYRETNKSISVNKYTHDRYTDDAAVIRAKSDAKEFKQGLIGVLVIFGLLFGIIFGSIMWLNCEESAAEKEGKISAGNCDDLIGEDYKMVKAHFEAAGFTNVEMIDLDDTGIDFWNEGDVAMISIGGDTDFESTDWFYPDVKVVISYH